MQLFGMMQGPSRKAGNESAGRDCPGFDSGALIRARAFASSDSDALVSKPEPNPKD